MATRTKCGIFILAPITGVVGAHIAEVQETYDPRLARLCPPHGTLAGSSGHGAIAAPPTNRQLRAGPPRGTQEHAATRLLFGAPTPLIQTRSVSFPPPA